MLVRALKTFRGRYGLIRTGNEFECEPGYFRQLANKKMAEVVAPRVLEQDPRLPPTPPENKSIPNAPRTGGKGVPGDKGKPLGNDTVPRTGAGKVTTSRSLRADLASRGKTSTRSAGGVTVKGTTDAAADSAANTEETDPPPATPDSVEGANGAE